MIVGWSICQAFILAQGVESAGFTGIGTAGKRHLSGAVVRKLGRFGGTDQEVGAVVVVIHRRMVTGVRGVSNRDCKIHPSTPPQIAVSRPLV